jgi:RNA polymerase primary sigma factor
MANTAETPEAEAPADGPLLDLTDAGVKKFIKQAKARGYVTMDELNKVLPSEEFTSEQIEDTLAMLSEMGVNVVENEEQGEEAAAAPGEVAVREETAVVETESKPAFDRTDDPCACTCARWARWSCSPARARSPSPSASRPAATP